MKDTLPTGINVSAWNFCYISVLSHVLHHICCLWHIKIRGEAQKGDTVATVNNTFLMLWYGTYIWDIQVWEFNILNNNNNNNNMVAQDSTVRTATCYRLDGPNPGGRVICYPSRPAMKPIQLPVQCILGLLPRRKADRAWRPTFTLF